jgi:glucosamine--fructose-6-phosphate aminotransferase (isomerizing)
MNGQSLRYTQFALVREMLETPGIIRQFNFSQANALSASIKHTGRLFMTGEGSSRLFPSGHFIAQLLRRDAAIIACAEGARQAGEYDLSRFTVLGASNSGRTREVVELFQRLAAADHAHLFSLSAAVGSPLGDLAREAYVLGCGAEDAVAATKSVVEQALFLDMLLNRLMGMDHWSARALLLADVAQSVLELPVAAEIARTLARANVLHWAGRHDGVAAELALKTNEITRKRSAYLEGTYAVHGIEEVMSTDDAVIIVDPFEAEEEKFDQVLRQGVGCTVVAIAARPTRFPTICIPSLAGYDAYLQLMTGWNLLVEIALLLGINMDRPVRARKIGNAV